jgi:hypothetical protein
VRTRGLGARPLSHLDGASTSISEFGLMSLQAMLDRRIYCDILRAPQHNALPTCLLVNTSV